MKKIPFSFVVSFALATSTTYLAQNFVAYQTGNPSDTVVQALGGVCLMGGATEDDNAMSWFLQRANGGDVLVLRTSGANGYNSYLYSQLGVPVNSVETIVCNNAAASNEAYVLQKINQAEAIWFAGGDQWTYVSFWRNTPVEVAINEAIHQRNIVVGGTSAGMAIQGKYYFSAQNGTVTSSAALGNPFNPQMTVDSTHFIENTTLSHQIKGNATGNNTFDLNNWQTGAGGEWFQWSALQGVFLENVSDEIACDLALFSPKDEAFFQIYPNPTHHVIHHNFPDGSHVFLRSFNGKLVWEGDVHGPIATENFPPGIYGIQVLWEERQFRALVVIE
ncbi:MAG: hypothetical protein EB023_05220 [Flavobacteriia bacterium]|nr:hypothetical protein [Flavobacteriia bacterium]